jgi:hypothetical protein
MRRSALVLLVFSGVLVMDGCGSSGVGSVDWAESPKARAVGAPPGPPLKPAKPAGQSRKKPSEYISG